MTDTSDIKKIIKMKQTASILVSNSILLFINVYLHWKQARSLISCDYLAVHSV